LVGNGAVAGGLLWYDAFNVGVREGMRVIPRIKLEVHQKIHVCNEKPKVNLNSTG
jgi:hypothetical protein